VSNIHWDYADSFTGREAAYLICGLEPSSWSVESEYKVRPIVTRLKKSYYAAARRLADDLDGAGFKVKDLFVNVNPFKHRAPAGDELWSYEIEGLIDNYNYQYMAADIPEEFEFCYSDEHGLPFEEIKRREDARLNSLFTDERERLDARVFAISDPISHWAFEDVHEFDDQQFSRSELHRWIRDNNFPSQYQFSGRTEATENELATKERNTLLAVIAALCNKADIDPIGRAAASEVVRLCDDIGVKLSDDTARKVLRKIPDALSARGK